MNPIWNINDGRMWTAAQVFLYGCLRYFLKGEWKGLVWSAASSLVHFAFFFPVAALFVWLFLPLDAAVCLTFYLATSLVHEVNLHLLRESLSFMPEVFQPRVAGYTSESYAQKVLDSAQGLSWHTVWAPVVLQAMTYAWVLAAFLRRGRWAPALPGLHRLFVFTLFLAGFSNLASLVPLGGRFLTVTGSLFFALFVCLLGQRRWHLRVKPLELVSIPLLAFSGLFYIRMGLDYAGILAVFGNPVSAPLYGDQTPLISYLKHWMR
jgi:hypothetical protein